MSIYANISAPKQAEDTPETLDVSKYANISAPLPVNDTEQVDVAVRQAPTDEPQRLAQDVELSRASGIEPSVVSRNREEIQKRIDNQSLVEMAAGRPAMTKFMADRDNVGFAKKDIPALAKVEDFFLGGVKSIARAPARLIPTAASLSLKSLGFVAGVLDEAAQGVADTTPDWMGMEPGGYFGQLRDESQYGADWIQKNVLESDLLDLPEEKKGRLWDNPQYLMDPEWLIQNTGDAAASLAVMAGAAIATGGGTMAGAVLGGLMEGGDLYSELLDEGVSNLDAIHGSMAFGAVVAGLEKIGLDRILGKERVKSLASRFGKAIVTGAVEGTTEYLEEPAQAFFGSYAANRDFGLAIEKAIEALTNVDVIPGAFLSGGGVSFHTKYKVEQQLSEIAEENLTFFQNINEGMKGVELREHAPDRLMFYAKQIEEIPGSPDSIYIPADALEQAIGNSQEFNDFLSVTGTADQLEAAQATGGDIQIPISEFLTRMAGTDTAVSLENDIRFSPEQMTPRESREWQENVMDVFGPDIKRAQEAAERIKQEDSEDTEVMDTINHALNIIGVNPQESEADAAIWNARANIAAKGYTDAGQKMSPLDWLKQLNLTFRNEKSGAEFPLNWKREDFDKNEQIEVVAQKDPDGITYFQNGEVNRDENFKKWFGDSKVVDADGNPLVVYHGTDFDFSEFDRGELGKNWSDNASKVGFFFSLDKNEARSFGNSVGEYYLSADDLFVIDDDIINEYESSWLHDLENNDREEYEFQMETKQYQNSGTIGKGLELAIADVDTGSYDGVKVVLEDFGGQTEWYVVFSPTQIKSIFNQKWDGTNPDILKQGEKDPQGQIQFRQNAPIITLLKKANRSTFMHESAHLFLNDMQHLASLPWAPAQIKGDWSGIREYLGVKDYAEDLTEEQHETFARSFEAYLREGKAPSPALLSAFRSFKQWLTKIYRTVMQLDVPINDDIRGIFDRMLATEDMMAEVIDQQQAAPLFATADDAGMSDKDFSDYQQANTDAIEKAKERLLEHLVKQIEKRNKAWYRDKRKETADSVKDMLLSQEDYGAVFFIKNGYVYGTEVPEDAGRIPLNTEAIKELGYDHKDLAKSVPPLYSKDGMDPDVMADLLGFSSGQQFLDSLTGLPPLGARVEELTDESMREYDEVMTDTATREEAEAALENEARIDVLALENEAVQGLLNKKENQANFAKRSREAAARAKLIRLAAEKAIASMLVPQAGQVYKHLQAERRAAKKAERAAASGNTKALAEAKYQQLVSAALASAAGKAKTEIDTTRNYLAKFESPGVRKNLARDYLDQIDHILSIFDLRKSTTVKQKQRDKTLTAWIEEQRNMGFEPNISEKAELQANQISYKELTLDELRGIKDSVKSIETLGRFKERLLTARSKIEFSAMVDKMVVQAEDTYGDKIAPGMPDRPDKSMLNKLGTLAERFEANLSKVEFMMQILDDGKMNGIWWENIYRPVNDGSNRKAEKFLEIRDFMYGEKMFGKYTPKELSGMGTKKVYIKEIDKSFTREQLIAIGLNRGNPHNWSALTRGEAWTMEQSEAVLSKLTETDWDVIQNTWDYINTFWPDIKKLYRKLSGTPPKKVAAEAFTTPAGRTMAGGYYPLKGDADISIKASQREEKVNVQEMFGGNAIRPSTRNGHTIERKGFKDRVSFSLDVLVRHLDQITHDIYLREAVIDVDRMLQDQRVQNIIIRTLGREQYDQLRPWLASVAGQKPYDYDGFQPISRFFRKNATMAMMGLKATIFFSQYVGVLNVVPFLTTNTKMGTVEAQATLIKNLGITIAGASKSSIGKFVDENSLELKDRRHNFQQEVTDLSNNFGFGKKVKKWQEAMMYFTALADYHVSAAAWYTAYNQATSENKTKEQAKDFADSIVRMSQASGKTKDLSKLQDSNEHIKAFMMFYSYMNVNLNQITSSIKNFRTGKRKGKFIGEMMFFWFAPAVLAEIVAGRGPGPEDDEKWQTWVPRAIKTWLPHKLLIEHPMGLLPFGRDMFSAAFGKYGQPASPYIRAFSSLGKTVNEATDGDGDNWQMFWRAIDTVGYFAPFPSSQARITGRQFQQYMTGERDDLSLFFYDKN